MTENKRFYYYGDGEDINSEVIDGDTELTLEETVGIMNELHEDNEQLKKENKRLKRSIAPSVVVDANVIAETIATCRGITVEEYLEEVEKEYTREGEKE